MKEITRICAGCSKGFTFIPKDLLTQVGRKYCSRPCALSGIKKSFDNGNQQHERIRTLKQENTKYLWK